MKFHEGVAKLKSALKVTRLSWDETEALWQDEVRRNFEEKHFVPLENQIEATLREVQRMAEVLGKAEKDCR